MGPARHAGALPRRAFAGIPLSVAPDKRRLIDASGAYFLINGDTPWSLMVALTHWELTEYLDDRQSRGFNTILANLIEHRFAPDPPRNVEGVAPFTAHEVSEHRNDVYFDRCASIVGTSAQTAICWS